MPTLVYQLEYPRSGPIRWGWVCRRVVELSVLSALQVMFVEQYIVPLCKNAIAPFAEQNFMKMAERILKLAVSDQLCSFVDSRSDLVVAPRYRISIFG